ncbi:gliding motility-associated-like protein [Anseongella ginsenosidimutans]|uniref:Gliding motility-associated-like protein n=1 Tax=Anseongella ginsenosidimutans TaxID=496056 RepID=A0A4V2UTA6_9SPHI|nr:gliding motility-associated C-terminal domain-containing protein [Anseongella ginsenosidimutans]TCS85067.1 gliding motility-associated-like protein [Anseongella ginsenosidimutans]
MNAPEGAELWLKQGIYAITQTLDLSDYDQAGMSLYGGFNGTETSRSQRDYENNETILDGLGSGRILYIDAEDITANGLIFRNGFIAMLNEGGGAISIHRSGTVLKNCIFRSNISESDRGAGAIYNRSGSGLLIDNCLFENNRTQAYAGDANGGGAIHNWADDVTITNSIFRNNSSHNSGGALYSWYDDLIYIDDCVFEGNQSASSGGAIHMRSQPAISNTEFTGNSSAGDGGAIYSGEELTLDKVIFLNNTAGGDGGAIYTNSGAQTDIVNALFAGNQANGEGGAVFNNGGLKISNATFVSNENSAIAIRPYTADFSNIYNCIFYNNTSPDGTSPDILQPVAGSNAADLDVRRNILQAAIDPAYGSGNLVGIDPLFVDAAGGVYTLQTSSPAIDAGVNALFNDVSATDAAASTDLEGNTRVQGQSIDLGSYELDPSTITKPGCAVITVPADDAGGVALDAGISWNAVADASGYRVFIGTSAGGSDVVNGEQVTGTSFNPPSDFEENTTYYVRVIPFNSAGVATGCTEISFTTETLLRAPGCAVITAPANGAGDVTLGAGISWNAVAGASGYRVFIGTTAGGSEIVSGEEVTGTSFNPPSDFEENTTYYVRVIPYNAAGAATGCTEISFTTETLLRAPDCAVVTAPANGANDVTLRAGISWNAVAGASGYRVFIGTTAGGSEIVSGEEVTGTSFNPPSDFEENTTYYVRVIPYNAAGAATGCTEISFTTETLLRAPDCAVVTAPANGADDVTLEAGISWNAVPGASGYRVFVGTTSGGSDVVSGEEVTATSFNPPGDFEENTTYYVWVIPFNSAGAASGCTEISFTTETLLRAPDCAVVTAPANGANDVTLRAGISWNAVAGASAYRVFIGTTAGGSEIVSGEEVTGTNFNPPGDFEENTTYYVRVIPYNSAGAATGCTEINFTTETLLRVPDCAVVMAPANDANNVSLDANISWHAVAGATGYRVFAGTTPGGMNVANGEEVTDTNYELPTDLEENTTYYVRVIPYNAAGAAVGCTEISFTTTETSKNISRTKYGISPNGDGINDLWIIEGIEYYPENTVSIYNRWGDMVFQIRDYDNQSKIFTGLANRLTRLGAGALPSGTYFFNIKHPDKQGINTVKGFLVLKR